LLGLSIVAFGSPLSSAYALRAVRSAGQGLPALIALFVSGLLLIAASIFIIVIVLHREFGLGT
jgi:hypothetical protein